MREEKPATRRLGPQAVGLPARGCMEECIDELSELVAPHVATCGPSRRCTGRPDAGSHSLPETTTAEAGMIRGQWRLSFDLW